MFGCLRSFFFLLFMLLESRSVFYVLQNKCYCLCCSRAANILSILCFMTGCPVRVFLKNFCFSFPRAFCGLGVQRQKMVQAKNGAKHSQIAGTLNNWGWPESYIHIYTYDRKTVTFQPKAPYIDRIYVYIYDSGHPYK